MNLQLNIEKYVIKTFEDRRDRRFLNVELWIVSEGQNINASAFTPESLELSKDRFKNISLSAKYERIRDDFKGHEVMFKGIDEAGWAEYEYIEVPIGVIPESSNPRIEIDEHGKQWIVADGLIWAERNRDVEKLLKRKKVNNISMEIKVLDYEMNGDIQVIKDFLPMSVVFISNLKRPGIANAKGIVKEEDVKMFSDSLVLAFEANIGMGEAIKKDLKTSSISNDSWGEIDKPKLRDDILNAENYEDLINICYLIVEDGWQDAPSEKLGYPVCQIKNGKLVYNRNAIVTARRYLERNKGEDYYNSTNSKLIKIEKKIGLWKEYDYARFEGGVSLDNEKIKSVFLSMFGANLMTFENGIVAYLKRENENLSFACKKYSIESAKNEDGEDSESVLVSEEEFACEPKFVFAEKVTEEDGQEVVTEKFACGSDKMKEFILSTEQFAADKEKVVADQAKQNAEFESKISELNKNYESLVSQKTELELKNKQYEQEKTFEKMKVVVKKYESVLGSENTKEWEAKAKTYEAEDALEKDILFFMYSEKNNNEHFRSPARNPKAENINKSWQDILQGKM